MASDNKLRRESGKLKLYGLLKTYHIAVKVQEGDARIYHKAAA